MVKTVRNIIFSFSLLVVCVLSFSMRADAATFEYGELHSVSYPLSFSKTIYSNSYITTNYSLSMSDELNTMYFYTFDSYIPLDLIATNTFDSFPDQWDGIYILFDHNNPVVNWNYNYSNLNSFEVGISSGQDSLLNVLDNVRHGTDGAFFPFDVGDSTFQMRYYIKVYGARSVYKYSSSSGAYEWSYPSLTVNATLNYTWCYYRKVDSDIQNQTNTLTNGYDNSSMTSDNTRLNDQISQYDSAQEDATNTSVSNIDAAEFYDPSASAPVSVLMGMTLGSDFLYMLFEHLGDFSIPIMVSLSLCLGLMLVGWFKYRKGG